MARLINRREMLRRSAATGTAALVLTNGILARGASPNEKLDIAVIGLGGRGSANLSGVAGENIVALCDVDDERAGKAYEKFPKAKKYYDFRPMLDEMQKEIDAVVISTPDHTHYHPAIMAMERDKHCYCEKPMAHAVSEVRRMTDLAREKGLATQLGVQRHTIPNIHRIVELIESGAIGEVRECHAWIGGDRGMPPMPAEFPAAPAHLKWDLWLGPAADRPYSPSYVPYNWRFWWDFGTGEMGNWGCHILDIPYWALDLKHCTKVSASGPEVDPQRTPKSLDVRYEFPARGNLPPLVLNWYHTKSVPPVLKELGISLQGANNLFIGSKGMLLCGFNSHVLLPEDKFAGFERPAPTIPDSPGFYREWITACKGGEPATCKFDYSGPMAETVLLGNVAYRTGEAFEWNAAELKATNCTTIDALNFPKYRKGWEI
jgi:predicted dehydrogenase